MSTNIFNNFKKMNEKVKISLITILGIIAISFILASCSNFMKVVKLRLNHTLETESYHFSIPFEHRHGRIIIEANVNGKGNRKFILDNGVGVSAIFKNHSSEFGLSKSNIYSKTAFVTGDMMKNYFFNPTTLTIHELSFKDISFLENDNPLLPDDKDLCGIIGELPIMKSSFQINYKLQTITFFDDISKLDKSTLDNKIEFDEYDIKLTLPSTIGKTSVEIIIDLGNSGVLRIPQNIFEKLSPESDFKTIVKGNGVPSSNYQAKNNDFITNYVNVNEINLGGKNFKNIVAHNYKGAPLMLLGNDFLQNYIVTIDNKNHTIYLKFNKNFPSINHNQFGFRLAWKNKKSVVAYINDKENKLQLGDEIISINNVLSTDEKFFKIYNYYLDQLPPKTTINLKVMRNGQIIEQQFTN